MKEQNQDGSFNPGWNGPYKDPETPVRNTAHWLVSLLKAYDLTGETFFRDAAVKAADYLLMPDTRPMGASFFCRKNPHKDFSNGLIGQAWVIEALALASRTLQRDAYFDNALEVFEKHCFEDNLGLWRILNVDGSYAGIDMTFNHQLWFAMAGAMLNDCRRSNNITAKLNRFFDRANDCNFSISKNGRIIHAVADFSLVMRFGKFVMQSAKPARRIREQKKLRHKENGYHGFNLYAFAVLMPLMPDHNFWKSNKFKKAVNYINNKKFPESLKKNEFAYPYNPSGFEIAIAVERFPDLLAPCIHSSEWWATEQLFCCFDTDSNLMCHNTSDPLTLAARLYEATRLQDMDVELIT